MQNRIDKVLNEQGKKYADLVPLTGLSDYGIGKMAQASDDEDLGAWFSLARALDVSPAYLVGWSDKPNEDNVEESDAFKAYINNQLEPIPYYDFAKTKPAGGVKVTLNSGDIIYDSQEYNAISGFDLCGTYLHLKEHIIALNRIVSIEKVGAES